MTQWPSILSGGIWHAWAFVVIVWKQLMHTEDGEVMRLAAESKQPTIHCSVKTRSCGCWQLIMLGSHANKGVCSSMQSCRAPRPPGDEWFICSERSTKAANAGGCTAGEHKGRMVKTQTEVSHSCFLWRVKPHSWHVCFWLTCVRHTHIAVC